MYPSTSSVQTRSNSKPSTVAGGNASKHERCYSVDRPRPGAAARSVHAVPDAGPHHADAEAGQDPPRQGLPRHLRQHRVQPPAPRPLPRRRRRRWPRGVVPLRHHPGRPAGVRRRRHTGPGHHQLRHQAQLPASLPEPARRPGRRRDVRRGGQPDELLRRRCDGDGRALRALLDRQRLRLHGLPQLPPPHQQGHHPLQRRRAADERVHGHAGGLGAGHEQAHAAQGLPDVPPHHGPRRRADELPARGGGALRVRVRRRHQHLRRARAAGARRHARHHPGRLHHRPARFRRGAGGRRQGSARRGELQPVAGGPVLPRVAGRQEAPPALGGVCQLREHHGHERAGDGRVRVGAGEQRPRLPVDRPAGRREGRHLVGGGAAPGVPGGDRGQGPAGELVRPGDRAAARGGGPVPDAQRVELDAGEPRRRGADAVLAVLRGAADQLPVQVRRVGRGDGGRRRRAAGGRGGEGAGGDGWGEGEGDGAQGGGVETGRRGVGGEVAGEPRQAHQRCSALSATIERRRGGSLKMT